MDSKEIIKTGLEIFEYLEEFIKPFNWFYIGAGIFIFLLAWYIMDSLTGSQVSPMFLIVVFAFILIFGYTLSHLTAGM